MIWDYVHLLFTDTDKCNIHLTKSNKIPSSLSRQDMNAAGSDFLNIDFDK